jgi:putative ABC transport system permease protein
VDDVNEYTLASRLPDFADGAIYRPYGNGAGDSGGRGPTQPTEMTLVVRTANRPASLGDELRRIVASINPEVPLTEMQTLSLVVSQSLTSPRSTMMLFAIFAALAVLLGVIGVYGVISYGVAQRLPEFGVRLALGAQKRDVMWLVMAQAGRLTLIGAGMGIAGALVGTRLLSSLLFAVSTADALTYSAVTILLTIVALAACYIPARRAAKVDPMAALRYE